MVVDGRVGFTGGINVSDKYIKGDPKLGHWRDTHLRLEGRAVNFLQYIFLTDWQFVSKQNLLTKEYFPSHEAVGPTPVQISASGPDSNYASIHQTFVSMLYQAQKYIYLANAYLIPDESLLMALKATALSGVDVRLMVPRNLRFFYSEVELALVPGGIAGSWGEGVFLPKGIPAQQGCRGRRRTGFSGHRQPRHSQLRTEL